MIVLLLLIIFLKFSHYHLKKRFLTGIIICLILTGCSKNSAGGDVVIDGTLNGQISLSKDEYVYYIDQNEDVVYRKDNSNNTVAVTRNVFPLSGRITNIYLSEDKCYYLLENDRNVGISVYSVDLNSFKNELVYSSGGDNTEDFYGLADKESSDASEILENIATVKWFFVTDKYVYYQKESVIYKCPITGRKQYVIDENVSEVENFISVADTFGLLKNRSILLLFMGIFFIVGVDVATNFISSKLMAVRFGWSDEQMKFAPQVYFLCRTFGALLGAFLLTRISGIKYFKVNIIACILSFLILIFVDCALVNLVCIGCVGFFASSVFPIIYSMALQVRPDKANQISGLMITAIAGGGVVTPVIGFAIGEVGIIGGAVVTLFCVCYLAYCAFGIRTVDN